jgi:alkyldihydroxyacetonephosphate synthase
MRGAYEASWRAIMEATAEAGGGIAHHHGIGRVRRPYLHHELGSGGLQLLRTLKRSLDPKGIMNPGVLLPDA